VIAEGFPSIQGNARAVLLARIPLTSPCSWRGAQACGLVSAAGDASFLTQIFECMPWLSKIDSIDLVLPER
jgi:hypothetical protein